MIYPADSGTGAVGRPVGRDFPAVKFKMAESEEVEVDYYAVLNVRKEVKIVFQSDRRREIFDQSCKVHFVAFPAVAQ